MIAPNHVKRHTRLPRDRMFSGTACRWQHPVWCGSTVSYRDRIQRKWHNSETVRPWPRKLLSPVRDFSFYLAKILLAFACDWFYRQWVDTSPIHVLINAWANGSVDLNLLTHSCFGVKMRGKSETFFKRQKLFSLQLLVSIKWHICIYTRIYNIF